MSEEYCSSSWKCQKVHTFTNARIFHFISYWTPCNAIAGYDALSQQCRNPGDTICIQTRMSHNYSECKNHNPEPPFHLPVAFEDDYFALVNKPENIVVFSHKNGGFGRESVNSCLPWVLTPPRAGVVSVMRRPSPCHRIDRGTSGLLVCAKTKPAMIELTKAFRERRVKKTYTAIVNGDILEPKERSITSQQAKGLGVCIEDENNSDLKDTSWQMIDDDIEDQSAVTIWKPLRKWSLDNARNNTVSLVELKPKTGRYHQLRRHMVRSWMFILMLYLLMLRNKSSYSIQFAIDVCNPHRLGYATAPFSATKSMMGEVLRENFETKDFIFAVTE